ncbi:hypothetical protein JCM8115_006760 [Rhodotorula mucilaginosa]
MSKQKPDQDGSGIDLPLVRGAPDQRMSLILFLQTIVFGLSHLFFVLPLKLFLGYFVFRPFNPLVKDIGRPLLADALVRQIATCYDRWTPAQIRLLLDRKRSYALTHAASEFKGWIQHVKVNGTAGRWLAPPKTDRKDDDVVIYFVHGGGFIFDSGTNAQAFFLDVIKSLKKEHGVAASVFFLDYRLAPEYKYPSQLIETLAGYHYLVNSLGIPESKIVLGGDSAGANLASAFLLHLARPNPAIKVPESLGQTPKRPAGALLISPYTNLFGSTKSFYDNAAYDIISPSLIARAAFAYIGAKFPTKYQPRRHGWNPLYLLFGRQKLPPQPAHRLPDVYGWSDVENIKLFQDPYVNPFVCNDASWWKEACPGNGKTLVAWGGKEIFVDDDQALYDQLEKAGVEPVRVFHPLKLHDWLLHDYGLPMSHRVRRLGNELDDFHFGLKQTVKFIAHVIDETDAPSQPRLDTASSSAVQDIKGDSNESLRNRGGERVKPSYSDEAVAATVGGLRAAEHREASSGAPADYGNEAVLAASVGLRRAEQQAESSAPAAQSSATKAGKSASKVAGTEKAKKGGSAQGSVPTTDDGDHEGSYAAIAAHDDHIASDAPIVAEGEGDKIKPTKEKATPSEKLEKPTVQQPAEPKAPTTDSGEGSYAAIASHHDHIAPEAPIVAEGEGSKIKPVSEEAAQSQKTEKSKAEVPAEPKAPTTDNGEGSYAAIASHHDHIAPEAPIVAEGEGSKIKPASEEAARGQKLEKSKAQQPAEPKAPTTDSGEGSYAAIASHHDHIAPEAPIVAEGEGSKIKPASEEAAQSQKLEKSSAQQPAESTAPTTGISAGSHAVNAAYLDQFAASMVIDEEDGDWTISVEPPPLRMWELQTARQPTEMRSKESQERDLPQPKGPEESTHANLNGASSTGTSASAGAPKKKAKSKRKKAKKATQPNADSNGGGSYAAIAAHHDRIASDAPIVAEGEGDVIHPTQA